MYPFTKSDIRVHPRERTITVTREKKQTAKQLMPINKEAITGFFRREPEVTKTQPETFTPEQQLALWVFYKSTEANTREVFAAILDLRHKAGVNIDLLPSSTIDTVDNLEERGFVEAVELAKYTNVVFRRITDRGKKAMAQVRKQKGIPYQTVTVDVPVKAEKLGKHKTTKKSDDGWLINLM